MRKRPLLVYVADWYNDIQRDLLTELHKKIDVIMIISNSYPQHKKCSFPVLIFDAFNIGRFTNSENTYMIYYKKTLFDFLNKAKPDFIVCNLWQKFSTIQIANYCSKNKINFILQEEMKRLPKGLVGRFYIKLLYFLLGEKTIQKTKMVLPWTESAFDFWKKRLPLNKLELLPAGIDTSLFVPLKKKKNKKLNILCVARFIECKWHVGLLQTCFLLKKEGHEFMLHLVGKGPLREEMMKFASNLGLTNIEWTESVPYEKMPSLYSKSDLLVLPSSNEAIGMVVPEAMACGLPVVVSDACGATTYVKNNENGFIFRAHNIEDLAQKISYFFNEKQRLLFGKRAAKHIKTFYDNKVIGKKFIGILKKIIKENI